jgi:DNA-binding transcriptional MerR regulator
MPAPAVLTVGRLARRFHLARSTLLYYARIGLLRPSARSAAGYRLYSEHDAERLAQICRYRAVGLGLREVAALLDAKGTPAAILAERLDALNQEIARCRDQQRVILGLMRGGGQARLARAMDKKRWVALLRASGLSDADMRRWHVEFERMAPQAHHDFLESLGVAPAEVAAIRRSARVARGDVADAATNSARR